MTPLQIILAAAGIIISAASLGLNVLLWFVVQPLRSQQQRSQLLEQDLKNSCTQLIEVKLAAAIGGNQASIAQTGERMTAIENRLQRGDTRFAMLSEKDHSLEVKILVALADLKDSVATKDDLQRLREEMKNDQR